MVKFVSEDIKVSFKNVKIKNLFDLKIVMVNSFINKGSIPCKIVYHMLELTELASIGEWNLPPQVTSNLQTPVSYKQTSQSD